MGNLTPALLAMSLEELGPADQTPVLSWLFVLPHGWASGGGRVSALCSWGENLSADPSGRNVIKGLLSGRGASRRGEMILGHA